MRRLRHRVANALYRVGARLDCAVPDGYDEQSFGERESWPTLPDGVSRGQVQIHGDNQTPVSGTFMPTASRYRASRHSVWLNVGSGVSLTLFLTRPLTRRLIVVLGQLDAEYARHGESA